jgi:hypothetical protein
MRKILVTAALAVLLAGCGASAQRQKLAAPGVPRVLAREWASRASAVAVAANSGNNCHALQLAAALRDDVISAQGQVPARLRSPLVSAVRALADRFKCTPKPTAPAKGPKPPKHRDHHGHGGDNGDHQ